MSSAIHIINLLVSLLAAAFLLAIGIRGVIKKDVSVGTVKESEIKVAEWIMISLGALLLLFSIWNFAHCRQKEMVSFSCSSNW